MSADVSNIYAMRIFSENPIALWPLDDNTSFIPLLTASARNIQNWSKDNGVGVEVTSACPFVITKPVQDDVFGITKLSSSGIYSKYTSNAIPFYALDSFKKTINISTFLKRESSEALKYKIGFKYNDTLYTKEYNSKSTLTGWEKISHTIEVPNSEWTLWADGDHKSKSSYFTESLTRINLIPNPSFELDTSYWQSASSTISRITSGGVFGNCFGRFTSNINGSFDIVSINNSNHPNTQTTALAANKFRVNADQSYSISLYIKSNALRNARVNIEWLDDNLNYISTVDTGWQTLTSLWNRRSVVGVAPPNCFFAEIKIQIADATVGNQFDIDGVLFEQASSTSFYFDGSSSPPIESTIWTGDTNNSPSVYRNMSEIRKNLIYNPSFESNLLSWSLFGYNVSRETSIAKYGESSAKIVTGTFVGYAGISTIVEVAPSMAYSLGAWVKTDSLPGSRDVAGIQIDWYDSNSEFISQTSVTNISVSDWTHYKIQNATSPSTASYCVIKIYTSTADPASIKFTSSGTFYVDGCMFEQSSTVGEYFDGNSISPLLALYGYIEVEYLSQLNGKDFNVYFNGLSVGQWAENYNHYSTGKTPEILSSSKDFYELLPSSSAQYKYYVADSYGISNEDDGYYLLMNNNLLSSNNAISMIYGSLNSLKLYPSYNGAPSIVFPGNGFLNSSGQYSEITAEFWLRVSNKSNIPRKIFGPLGSKDGLYLEEEFLTLRIDKYSQSHYITKWFRPMLIDICYTPTLITLLVNSETVISIDITDQKFKFPKQKHDWVGFYTDNNSQPMEIDCFAIYPYKVSEDLSKRRFVYGQGVDSSQYVSSNFRGEVFFVDYSNSQYSANINYPETKRWSSGYSSNLEVTNRYISLPDYSLPTIQYAGENFSIFDFYDQGRYWGDPQNEIDLIMVSDFNWGYWNSNGSWEEVFEYTGSDLLEDNYKIQDTDQKPFITMTPSPEVYVGINPYIYYDNFSLLKNSITSFLGLFESSASSYATTETVMYMRNKTNNHSLRVDINSSSLIYIFNNGFGDTTLQSSSISANSKFIIGMKVDDIARNYRLQVNNFFDNEQDLTLQIGGYGTNTFAGKMYSFTFNGPEMTARNNFNYFNNKGFASSSSSSLVPQIYVSGSSSIYNHNLFDYTGNYTLIPYSTSKTIELDIAAEGYWESYIPLSFFGKQVLDKNNKQYYDLDMIQFNVDYPSETIESSDISNLLNNSDLKIYATLQNSFEIGTIPYSRWTSASVISSNRVIDFDNTHDVTQSKYELVDGTIIFPPKELVDFTNYNLAIHAELKTKALSRKQIKLQKMSLASTVSDQISFFEISSESGKKAYSFSRYGGVYQYKEKNPYLIYKDTTPYLYLTSDSGIRVLPYGQNSTRGIAIPINSLQISDYVLGGIQFWCMYGESELFTSEKIVARLNVNENSIYIKIIPESNGRRAVMKAYYENGVEFDAISYYQNSNLVDYPYIEPMCWNSITLSFGIFYSLTNQIGFFEVYSGLTYNNIGFYKQSLDEFFSYTSPQRWNEIYRKDQINNYLWSKWNQDFTWGQVYNTQGLSLFSISGSDIYDSYLGITKEIGSDSSTLMLDYEKVRVYSDVTVVEFQGTPL